MSSGKGSSGANSSHDYYGTACGIGGIGPLLGIASILVDGKQVFGASGPLMYNGTSVSEGYVLSIPSVGIVLEIHWGLPSAAASSFLNSFADNPPYRGFWYFVLKDSLLGTERKTPPNIEVVPILAPLQTIVTGSSANLDSNRQANAGAVAAEYAQAWHGMGLPTSRINTTSFQTLADDLRTDSFLSVLAPCSPKITSPKEARQCFGDLQALYDGWFRFGIDGKLEAGRWKRGGPSGSVTVITANEWVTPPKDYASDFSKLPNGFDVVFTDASQLFQETSQPFNGLRAKALGYEPRRQQLQRQLVQTKEQAILIGQEADRLQGNPTFRGSVDVRPTQALNPDGTPIRYGDYFELDVNQEPGGTAMLQLCRCTGRTFDPTSAITLEYEFDSGVVPTPYQVIFSDATPTPYVVPPLFYQRTLSLQPAVGEDPAVYLLALRHEKTWTGVQVYYDDLISGDYTLLGSQIGFALPVSLQSSVSDSATTIRVNTIATFSGSRKGDIDKPWIQDAVGISADASSRNNELLLILVRKNPATGEQYMSGPLPWMEICSVVSVAQVTSSQFDVDVLRARVSTTPFAFDTQGGAISFPDNFYAYEGWIIPRSLLKPLYHADFPALVATTGTGYFQFAPFTKSEVYNPAEAYAAGLQASSGWEPTWAYQFPRGFDNSPVITLTAPTVPATTSTAGAITLTFSVLDPNNALSSVSAFSSYSTDGGSYTSHLEQKLSNTGTFSFSASITIPNREGTHTLTIKAVNSYGLDDVRTVNIYRAVSSPTFTLNPPDVSPTAYPIPSAIAVTLTAPAGSSGSAQIQYSRDGSTWTTHTAGVTTLNVQVNPNSLLLARMKDGTPTSGITSNYYPKQLFGTGQYI